MKVLQARWMREVDAAAIQGIGIPGIVLMENAARGSALCFREAFPLARFPRVVVLVGKGNNGGDGLAVARILRQWGYRVRTLLLCSAADLSGDAALNHTINQRIGMPLEYDCTVERVAEILATLSPADSWVVDALFGTGLSRPLQDGLFAGIIEAVNRSGLPVAAIDIPSGLSDQFPPEAGRHVRATVTATFQCLKLAHLYPDGHDHCGRIHIIDIGIPEILLENPEYYLQLITPALFAELLRRRPVSAHKGRFGHVLTIAGSPEKPGAGILSAFAALRGGAGLCTAAVSPQNAALYVQNHPELMTLHYHHLSELPPRAEEFDAVLAGPGLGVGEAVADTVAALIASCRKPLVLDADALNSLQGRPGVWDAPRTAPLVLTPHPLEFARISGRTPQEILAQRAQIARDFAREHRLFLVLKGHHTVVATPAGRVWLNQTGNPGMATAGSGDVLGGLIAALLAQHPDPARVEAAVCAAVFLHGLAGDRAVQKTGEAGLTAGDILGALPAAFLHHHEYHSPFQLS